MDSNTKKIKYNELNLALFHWVHVLVIRIFLKTWSTVSHKVPPYEKPQVNIPSGHITRESWTSERLFSFIILLL